MLLQTFSSCHVKMTRMWQKARILFKTSWVDFSGHSVPQHVTPHRPLQRSKFYFPGRTPFSCWFYSPKLEKRVSGPSEKPYRWILRFQILILLWEVEKSKCANHYKRGLETCGIIKHSTNLVSEFKSDNIWSLFGKKKRSELAKLPVLLALGRFFLPKRGSKVIRFKFWDQIWNHITIPQLSSPIYKDFPF